MEKKQGWSNQLDSTVALVGLTLNYINVLFLPLYMKKYGGGLFLMQYLVMEVVIAAPLTFMFLSLGQYCSSGMLTCWKFAPIFSGIGGCMSIFNFLHTLYLAVLLGWMAIYLFSTNYLATFECSGAAGCQSALYNYYKEIFTDNSRDMEDLGPVQWKSALALLGVYVVIFLFLMFGVKVYGKIAYITTIVPVVCMICLLGRAMTLPGKEHGIEIVTDPDLENSLLKFESWRDAFQFMIFRELPLHTGVLITFGSYNKFHNDTFRDTMILTVCKIVFNIMAAFAMSGFWGYHLTKVSPGDYITGGFYAATVMMVQVFRSVPNGGVWMVIFFLGIVCYFLNLLAGSILALITGITDLFPILRRRMFWICALGATCLLLFLLALPLTTEVGFTILIFLDGKFSFFLVYGVILVSSCYAVGLIYGPIRFSNDIDVMLNRRVLCFIPWTVFKYIFITLMSFVLPWTIQVLGVFLMREYPLDNKVYVHNWEIHVRRFLVSLIILPLFLTAGIVQIVCFIKTPGGFIKRLSSAWQATRDWGPVSLEHRREVAPHSLKYGFVEDPLSESVSSALPVTTFATTQIEQGLDLSNVETTIT